MSQSFSVSRFGQYFKTLALPDLKRAGIITAAAFGITASLLCFVLFCCRDAVTIEDSFLANTLFFLIATMTGGAVACICCYRAVMAFKDWNRRESGWLAMLLPASQSEKYLSAYLWSAIIVPLAYVIAFAAAVALAWAFSDAMNVSLGLSPDTIDNIKAGAMKALDESGYTDLANVSWKSLLILSFTVGAWFQSTCFFAGSAIFNRHPILFSILAIVGINMLTSSFSSQIMPLFYFSDMEMSTRVTVYSLINIGGNLLFGLVILFIGWLMFKRRTVL